MFRQIVYGLISIGLCAGLLATAAQTGQAQSTTPTPPGPTLEATAEATSVPVTPTDVFPPPGPDIFSFSQLGFGGAHLRGPFSSRSVLLSLPSGWELTEGARLWLDLNTSSSLATEANDQVLGLTLEVTFNGVLLSVIEIDRIGERVVEIPISADALESGRGDGQYALDLLLNSRLDCDVGQQIVVLVRDTSRFLLPHRIIPLATDLTSLPRPIYQASFQEDVATLVVPDQPTASELQAALAVAAGFGQMTSGKLTLTLTSLSQLSAEVRDTQHLIFVGKAAAFSLLKGASLPAPIRGTRFEAAGAEPDDGIVQMVISPWNDSRVVLVVGGNSDTAVIKAAQAVSYRKIRTAGQANLALVAGVEPETTAPVVAVDRTLSDLGYGDVTFQRFASNTREYRFYVPPGYVAQASAYLNLNYSHSALLDYARSGMTISVNDEPMGSARFSDASTQPTTLQLPIRPEALKPGTNRLTIQATLVPIDSCADVRGIKLWLTIDSASLLHLPLDPSPASAAFNFDLGDYLVLFTTSSSLDNVAFVLAPNDPVGWEAAVQIAFDLGNRVDIKLANLVVVYGDAVPDEVRQQRDLLVIGRPSQLALIAELANVLPAPFEAGKDVAVERNAQVAYRVPPDVSLGYLELITSPWNSDRAVLAVLGNSDDGVRAAGAALTVADLRNKLNGNLAVIMGEQIVTSDTRLEPSPNSPLETAVSASTPGPAPTSAFSRDRPAWILPLLGMSVLSMLVVIGIVVITARRQHRARR